MQVFDIKKSNTINHYVAVYSHVKRITHVGLNAELVLSDNSVVRWRTDLYGLYVEPLLSVGLEGI